MSSELSLKDHVIVLFCGFFIFISCLIVNLIQLVNYLTIRYVNINLYRRLNAYFQYIVYSNVVVVAEWWSRSTVTVYYADESSRQMFGAEHSLVVANHRYEVDAAFLWVLAEKIGSLGTSKAFGKRELRWVPIIGWTFFFGEYIFLDRDWKKDSLNIGQGLDQLMAHKQPVILMIAAEGTRYTAEKYETSMKFAADKGLPIQYKHHLVPRVKGFGYSVKHLKENYPECALYNLQMAFDENRETIKVSNLVKGVPMTCSIYVKRIPMSSVPTDSDDEIAKYLYDMYAEKDRLMEYYYENKKFPGIEIPHPPSRLPIIILWTNMVLVGVPCIYLLVNVFISGNITLILMTSLLILSAFVGIYFAIRSAKISKGSTYGTLNGKTISTAKSDHKSSPKED